MWPTLWIYWKIFPVFLLLPQGSPQVEMLPLDLTVSQEQNWGGIADTILTELFKPCDCLSQNILRTKLETYGHDNSLVTFILDFQTSGKQGSTTKATIRAIIT